MKSKTFAIVMLAVVTCTLHAQMPISNAVASRAYDALQMLQDPAYHKSIAQGEASGEHSARYSAIIKDVGKRLDQDDEQYRRGGFNLMALLMIADDALTLSLLNLNDQPKMNRLAACSAILEVAIKERNFATWKVPGVSPCLDLPPDATREAVMDAVSKINVEAIAALKAQEDNSRHPQQR